MKRNSALSRRESADPVYYDARKIIISKQVSKPLFIKIGRITEQQRKELWRWMKQTKPERAAAYGKLITSDEGFKKLIETFDAELVFDKSEW